MPVTLSEFDVHYRLDGRVHTLKVHATDVQHAYAVCQANYPGGLPIAANQRAGTLEHSHE